MAEKLEIFGMGIIPAGIIGYALWLLYKKRQKKAGK